MAHDVFISYASGDKPVADAVCAKLEAGGIRCWIAPRDVITGVHYGEAIIDAIHECRIMVLVFSSKANLSGHIPKEIERAVSAGVTVMPLRIEDVTPARSLDYFIGSVHWLDALTPPLEDHLQKLAANVQTLLSRVNQGPDVPLRTAPPPAIVPPPLSQARATAHEAPNGPRSAWSYVVIGGLITIILVLGALIFWLKSQSPAPVSQTVLQSAASVPPPRTGTQSTGTSSGLKATEPGRPQPSAFASAVQTVLKKESAPSVPPGKNQVSLQYVPGSTVKIEQLIGEQDKERHQPTRNHTFSRYGLQGADLGYSFEHQGRAYFLFGTTVGRFRQQLGTIASTNTLDPEGGVKLDFMEAGKRYLAVESTDDHRASNREAVEEIEVPVAGISLGGQIYVVVSQTHPLNRTSDQSALTKFAAPEKFQVLRTISQQPTGHFIRMSMHAEPGQIAGMPAGGPFVLVWGTGLYRKSDAYLSIVPAAGFETGKGTHYFSGLDFAGVPRWSDKESDAKAIVQNGTLGDLSVTWCEDLGLWLMTYDSREPTIGILFSYSRTPWGPWSAPQVLFNAIRDGAYGKFIHNPQASPVDGLAGPVLGQKNQANPSALRGIAYAPYVVERWTKAKGSELVLYYVMSTLNPYVVVLMKSRLKVE
jgi:Domain of unknown function (DUF4185)/TIR domain